MCGQYEAFQEAANRQSASRQTCLKDLLVGNSFESFTIEEESHEIDSVESLENTKELITDIHPKQQTVIEKSTVTEETETYSVTSEKVVVADKKSFILTMALIDSCEIDPMIGMEGLTPYDFI